MWRRMQMRLFLIRTRFMIWKWDCVIGLHVPVSTWFVIYIIVVYEDVCFWACVYEPEFSINETHNARIMASIYCKVESYTTFRLLHHRHHHQYTNAPNNNGSTRFVFIFVFNSREKEPSNCACLDAFFSFPQPVSIFPMCLSHHSLNSLIAGSCIYFCSLRQFCAILFP